MSEKFYIADTHFGHQNVLRFDNRPFKTLEEMEYTITRNWNAVVAPGDIVYILGDFCWGKEKDWFPLLKALPGQKVLIRGNHDVKNPSKELRKQFLDICDYKEITDGKRHVVLSHYPMMFYKGAYNPDCYMLCGHVHTTRENSFLEQWRAKLRSTRSEAGDSCGNIYNVGCMIPYMDYTPRTLDEIVEGCKC